MSIKRLASTRKYDEVMEILKQVKVSYNNNYMNYTPRITSIVENIKEIQKLLIDISYTGYQQEIVEELKKVEEKVQELTKQRYLAYQKWARIRLTNCHEKFKSTSWVLGAKEKADDLFDCLMDINPSLLTYDMQSLYNSIYQKIYDKADKAAIQIKKAGHICRSLEDL